MRNIFNINYEKIENINGGDIYIEKFILLNNEIELKIIENEFKYYFELYKNNDLIFGDTIYFKNFEFIYNNEFNDKISSETYFNILNLLKNNDIKILNEIINEIDNIIIEIINDTF